MYLAGFPIPCRWVAVVGGIIYQLFAISAEGAMLIRCRSFTRYPKLVTYLTIPTWIVRIGLCIWLVTTIQGDNNVAGFICNTTMDYDLSAVMQYVKIATEVIILVFFLERVIALHRGSRNLGVDNSQTHWRRLALINAGITFLVILFEVLVGQVTVYLTDYLYLTYSLVNFIQANLVVLIVEDTKNVFKKHVATNNSASKQSNNSTHQTSNTRGYNSHDGTTISYADGIAAKTGRTEGHQPWSLTMRTPSNAPDSVSVHYSPHNTDRPGSGYYDIEQMDVKAVTSRYWDVDTESQDTIDGNNRWRYGKEDEIPMTYSKNSTSRR
ncbi:hypothetical protein BGZ76_002971 [Entomortierella beljakovae]|nr:hypothetical protein BGZ76_002971 [Entomortierella beljakovae]